jgi:hypothetical protein
MSVTKLVGISVLSWLTLAAFLERPSAVAALSGMLGPLTLVVASRWLTAETYRRTPERVTSVMIAAFGVKMLFIGVYVTVMLLVLSLRPIPFVASFTVYFVLLYAVEALYLKRLFAGGLEAR